MKISVSTLGGVILALVVLGWAILDSTDDPAIYLDPHAFVIVVGGTLTGALLGFRGRYVMRSIKEMLVGIFVRQTIGPDSLMQDVKLVLDWSKQFQSEGRRAAEGIGQSQSKDAYVQYLMGLVATGYTVQELRDLVETNIEESYFRKLTNNQILTAMAGTAPTMGMVGTLVGMIAMLAQMDDPSKLGPALSIALVATLYGVITARFLFLPAGSKLKQKVSIQRFREYLLLEGVCLILEKKSSLFIQDRLNSFLDLEHHYKTDSGK
jgi:chemotaxis protein MotA